MTRLGSAIMGGLVAGIVGGTLILGWGVVLAWLRHDNPMIAIEAPAFPFFGEQAMDTVLDGVVATVGLLVHFGVYALWGALFALCCRGFSREITLVSGAFWAFLVWVAMDYGVVPIAGADALVEMRTVWESLIGYLLFGIGTAAMFLPFQVPARGEIPLGGDRTVHP